MSEWQPIATAPRVTIFHKPMGCTVTEHGVLLFEVTDHQATERRFKSSFEARFAPSPFPDITEGQS